jgi:hypothetical protein
MKKQHEPEHENSMGKSKATPDILASGLSAFREVQPLGGTKEPRRVRPLCALKGVFCFGGLHTPAPLSPRLGPMEKEQSWGNSMESRHICQKKHDVTTGSTGKPTILRDPLFQKKQHARGPCSRHDLSCGDKTPKKSPGAGRVRHPGSRF